MVVPFTAGGPTDALMRILGERMRATLGQNLVVENVTGAAGTIGVGRVARAKPDGYTLSVGHWSTHVVNGAVYPLHFDLLTDLEPIALLTSYPMLLVSKNAVPANDVKEPARLAASRTRTRSRPAASAPAAPRMSPASISSSSPA